MGDWVHLNVRMIRQETDKAFQVLLDDNTMHWLPKSQIADVDDYEAGDENVTMSVTAWIAEQKELE